MTLPPSRRVNRRRLVASSVLGAAAQAHPSQGPA
jgi:hypothetical protein